MYSIVMLTALTATPDAPQFNGYFRDLFSRDNGCNGCSGAARYSCAGYGCGAVAYQPTSCSGCNGGGAFGLGDRVRRFFDRDNGGNGCCGARSYSCMGASYSCSGYSCFGAPAMSYTPMMSAGLSCQGGLHSMPAFDQFPPPPTFQGGPGVPGLPPGVPPSLPGVPGIPYAVPDPAPATGLRPAGHTNTLASNTPTARASVVVKLPADARLLADGRALSLTGTERKFVSPELPTGQDFVYRFTAEYERDGETVSVTKKVTVRAGSTVSVAFSDLTAAKPSENTAGTTTSTVPNKGTVPSAEPTKAAPASKPAPAIDAPAPGGGDRATITVKLPADATLYVDDRKSPSKEPVRSFSTPPLPTGREFAYVIKAEIVRNGQPETLTQKVPFRAGERVVVDFTSLGK